MAKIDTVQRNEKWFLSLRIFLFSSFFLFETFYRSHVGEASADATLTNNAAKYFKGLFDRATPIK